jgi:hypothetical protein
MRRPPPVSLQLVEALEIRGCRDAIGDVPHAIGGGRTAGGAIDDEPALRVIEAIDDRKNPLRDPLRDNSTVYQGRLVAPAGDCVPVVSRSSTPSTASGR